MYSTRRDFLLRSMAVLASSGLQMRGAAVHTQTKYVFIAESGNFGGENAFCIGALSVSNPRVHLAYIRALRRKYHYRSALLYRSTDKFRLQFSKAVLNYFQRTPDMIFAARLLAKQKSSPPVSTAAGLAVYEYHYKQLIQYITSPASTLSVAVNNHSKSGEDKLLRNYLSAEISHLKDIRVVRVKETGLLQLANLLTGCVCAEEKQISNKVKLATLRHIRAILGVKKLTQISRSQKMKFRVEIAPANL